jgi:ferrochelatase
MKQALFILAYGTPDSTAWLRPYLLDIRGGRPVSDEFVAEFEHRYNLIGGKSPLIALTYEQAGRVRALLSERGYDLPVYVGMRHWWPWIKDAVAEMHINGVEEAITLIMAPHYSSMSIGRYQAKVNEAQAEIGSQIKFTFVEAWYDQPKFEEAVVQHIRAGLEQFPTGERLKLVFSAHSLPARLIKMGDPYDSQLKSNAARIAARLSDVDWSFCYQSAADTGEPWLGPPLEEVVVTLAAEGYKQILVAPIGFVCDHVEILYDIDIEARQLAAAHGLRLERIESMNSDPLFIQAMADAIETAMAAPPIEEAMAAPPIEEATADAIEGAMTAAPPSQRR